MPYDCLLDMLEAYGRTIGQPFDGWGIRDVLKLFAHCVRAPQTWQKDLRDETGVSASKVNRFIDVVEEQGWIVRPRTRTPDAKKRLQMTTKGRQVVAEFERQCRAAAGTSRRKPARENGHATSQPRIAVTPPVKKSKRALIEEARRRSETFTFDDAMPNLGEPAEPPRKPD